MSWDFFFDRVLTCLLLLQIALILWNQRAMSRPRPREWDEGAPLVSVLVPARNEEGIIGRCLRHLLAQDYPNLEIVVIDDGSVDETAAVVGAVADSRVRLVTGKPLPEAWTGKNWACHQLAELAGGELLCFVDADTVLEPGAISAAVGVLDDQQVGLVSLLPRAEAGSAAGAVLLPMVTHALLGLFPMSLIHNSANPRLSLAFGPFILVTRRAYDDSGGHAAHPDHIVDDVELSRSVKAAGYRLRLVNGTDLVQTRWQQGLRSIFSGFSRNAYGALDYNPWFGSAVVFVLMPLLLTPFLRVGAGALEGDIPNMAVWQVLLLLSSRALTAHLGRDPQWTTPLHPVTVAFWGTTLAWSMVLSVTGHPVSWKDRDIVTRPVEQEET